MIDQQTTESETCELRVIVGSGVAVRRFAASIGATNLFSLSGMGRLTVWPMYEDDHDALHRAYGTGDWSDQHIRLSSRDVEQCAKCSVGERLAYLEAIATADTFHQAAAAWLDGTMSVRPTSLSLNTAGQHIYRPRRLWPLNMALGALGITPTSPETDAMAESGLGQFASNADLMANAMPAAS
ncbi:MAG: hypothetical protein AAFV45_09700 [Pseudomonadota bacterium]